MHFDRMMIPAMVLAMAAGMAMATSGLWAAWAQDPAHDADPWRVTQVDGEAWLRNRGSAARPAHKGDRLAAGGIVITGDGGLVRLFCGDTKMTVLPDSRTEIPLDDDHRGPTTVVHRLGNLLVQVGQPSGPAAEQPESTVFRVETPFLTASVKGTLFILRVEADAASLHVAVGTVEIRSIASGEVALLRAGQSASVSDGGDGRLRVTGAP